MLPNGNGDRKQINNGAGSAERRCRGVYQKGFFRAGPASSPGPALFLRCG